MLARAMQNDTRHWLVGLFFGLAACGPQEPVPEPHSPLVDHQDWVEVSASEDPFQDRPDKIDCHHLSWQYEYIGESSLEVSTAFCSYLSAEQPSLLAVRAHDVLELRLWHSDLDAPEPAEAHAALSIEDELVWEDYVPIPTDSAMMTARIEQHSAFEQGARVVFHLHNHGSNTWNLLDVAVSPE